MRSLLTRLERLENRRSVQGPNRTLLYDALNGDAATALANVGKPGKYVCVPYFGSSDDWERRLIQQQRALIAGNARTPRPPKKPEAQYALPTAHDAAPTAQINAIRKRMRFNR